METGAVFLIALALAVDAFAVALAAGVVLPRVRLRTTCRLAWHFGFFQAAMNVIGWGAGLSVRPFLERLDHWLAFGLLALVGIRMIIGALGRPAGEKTGPDPTRGRTLVVLSVATSIDSLAVGISFSLLQISIWFPALVIGVVAAVLTAAGLQLGRLAGSASRLGSRAEMGGGLVLLLIGLKILSEHGVFG